jgi:hypothetical protein
VRRFDGKGFLEAAFKHAPGLSGQFVTIMSQERRFPATKKTDNARSETVIEPMTQTESTTFK